MTTLAELLTLKGKTIADIEYEDGERRAYLITSDGYGIEVEVEPLEGSHS